MSLKLRQRSHIYRGPKHIKKMKLVFFTELLFQQGNKQMHVFVDRQVLPGLVSNVNECFEKKWKQNL